MACGLLILGLALFFQNIPTSLKKNIKMFPVNYE